MNGQSDDLFRLLTPTSTLLLSTAFATSYLSSIYLLPATRIDASRPPNSIKSSGAPGMTPVLAEESNLRTPSSGLAPGPQASPQLRRDRNHPSVIKARMLAVAISSSLCCMTIPVVLSRSSSFSGSALSQSNTSLSLSLLGLRTNRVQDAARLILYPLGLTASLFGGSIYIMGLRGILPFQTRGVDNWTIFKHEFDGWKGVRNYLVGPITEELVFRSCIIAISSMGGTSFSKLVFLTPLYFGLAHIHHAWEAYVTGGRTKGAMVQGVSQSTFQFVYTTVFGWYASFLFVRTGSLIPPFIVHAFCNWMGLPPIGWALQAYPNKKKSIWASYLFGISTFCYGLWRWTDPALFGGSLYWPIKA